MNPELLKFWEKNNFVGTVSFKDGSPSIVGQKMLVLAPGRHLVWLDDTGFHLIMLGPGDRIDVLAPPTGMAAQ